MNWLGQRFFHRRPLRSVLFICLLTLLSTLMVLGVSQYLLSQEQFKLMDRLNYTTVKLDDSHFADTTTVHSTSIYPSDWSEFTYIPGLEEELRSFHESSEQVLLCDHRRGLTMLCDTLHRAPEHSDMSVQRVMSVQDIDTSDMTIGEVIAHEKLLDEHKPLQFHSAVQGVITARCLKIEYHTVQQQILDVEKQQFIPCEALIYTGYFEIDHSQSHLSAVSDGLHYMKLSTWCLDEDFHPFFQEGCDYKIAATGRIDFNYPHDHYESEGFPFYGNTWGVQLVDRKPQYYLDASLFGEQLFDFRFDLQEISPDERGIFHHENLDRQQIPKDAQANLPWDLDEDKLYVTNIYGDESGPVWDLSQELTDVELAQKKALFTEYDKYISMNSRTFHAVLCRDPLLFPDFSDGNLYLEDKAATLEHLGKIQGPACIIPAQVAQYYDIEPGGKITAALAHTGYIVTQSNGDEMEIAGEIFDPYGLEVKLPTSLQELDYLDQAAQQEFTVAGCFNYKSRDDLTVGTIRDGREVTNGDRYFGGGIDVIDTIFVLDRGEGFDELAFLMPQTSSHYQDFLSNRANMLSVRLKNGSASVAKYLSDAEEAGLEEYVLKIDDHGYAAIEPVLQEMKKESISQLSISLAGAAVLLIFYFFMLRRFFRSDLVRMYVLGTEQRVIRSSFFSALGLYWLSAAILTAVISAVLLPQMEKNLQRKLVEINQLEQSFLFNKLSLLITVFAVIMLSSLLLSYLYSRYMAKTAQGE